MGQETLDIWELAVRVKKSPAMSTAAGSKEGCMPPLVSGGTTQLCWKPPGLLCMQCIWLTPKLEITRAATDFDSIPGAVLSTLHTLAPIHSPQQAGTNISPIFR